MFGALLFNTWSGLLCMGTRFCIDLGELGMGFGVSLETVDGVSNNVQLLDKFHFFESGRFLLLHPELT